MIDTKQINIGELEYVYLSKNMLTDTERVFRAKEAITKLSPADRNILLLYLELGCSNLTVAKVLNCTPATVYLKIKSIRNKIKNIIGNDNLY